MVKIGHSPHGTIGSEAESWLSACNTRDQSPSPAERFRCYTTHPSQTQALSRPHMVLRSRPRYLFGMAMGATRSTFANISTDGDGSGQTSAHLTARSRRTNTKITGPVTPAAVFGTEASDRR
jgi:hypothetical protein